MLTAKQLLVEARAIIAEPAHWTTRFLARDINGENVGYTSPRAVSFCSYGAMGKVWTDHGGDQMDFAHSTGPIKDAEEALRRNIPSHLPDHLCHISTCNDALDHAAMLAWWDKAIESVKE